MSAIYRKAHACFARDIMYRRPCHDSFLSTLEQKSKSEVRQSTILCNTEISQKPIVRFSVELAAGQIQKSNDHALLATFLVVDTSCVLS